MMKIGWILLFLTVMKLWKWKNQQFKTFKHPAYLIILPALNVKKFFYQSQSPMLTVLLLNSNHIDLIKSLWFLWKKIRRFTYLFKNRTTFFRDVEFLLDICILDPPYDAVPFKLDKYMSNKNTILFPYW